MRDMRFCLTCTARVPINSFHDVQPGTASAKSRRSYQLASLRFLKSEVARCATTILMALLAIPSPLFAQQGPSKVEKKTESMDARTVLEKGRTSASLPEGMVIRISACLGELDVSASGDRLPEGLVETWEFASNQVHRVEREYKDGKIAYHRLESRPFDSHRICKDLLEGKAIEIQARKGKGPETELAGTPYRRGSRSIEVVWNGDTILDLHETNGPVLDLYRESDARAFGALYERLASQARAAFRPKADKAPRRP
jgi:hypothetical protein